MRDTTHYALKAATADLVDRCGGQKRAGDLLGVTQQQISKLAQREADGMLSIRQKLVLEADCGEPVVTMVEADLLGFRLERTGPAPIEPDGCPLSAHAAVMQEVADVCRAFAQAQADGRYSRTDALTVGRELSELRRTIERFERVNARTMAGGGE
jgi:hypothetical protein